MKSKYIIIIISLVIVFLIVIALLCTKLLKKIEIKNIKSFSFSYTNGYAVNSNIIYTLKKENNKLFVSIKPYGIDDEEKLETTVDSRFLSDLENILNKYNVGSWNSFNKNNKYVLDGDSFSLSVNLENGKSISAHGYMEWPNNYNSVQEELDKLFMDIYIKELGNQ